MADLEEEEACVANDQSFFAEKEQVLAYVAQLCGGQKGEREAILADVTKILLKYQEQPHLLGPHIEDLVHPVNESLVKYLIDTPVAEQDDALLLDLCKFIQTCCRVRGFKQVAKHLPHEVYQLEPCCALLAAQDPASYDSWETRYVLLLWLSSLVLIPFDLTSMDSHAVGTPDLVQNLIAAATAYIGDPGPTREAAGFCLANLLTRPDMESQHLQGFLASAADVLNRKHTSGNASGLLSQDYFEYIGILSCLNQIFKRGHRSKLYPLAQQVYVPATALAKGAVQTVERKLLCKLIQRIGMTFLPPKEASWRYQRGQRSLNTLLHGKGAVKLSASPTLVVEEDDDVEYPPELEDIIDSMLSFLSDKDTVVRWSAAKGMGRITMRLTKALASDVIDAIMGVFEDESSDMNWHGGCLAIAELSRRGLLLPDKLAAATAAINKGMHFDILRGQHSVGAHVRDAACYVCWAFARAYSPKDLEAFRSDLFSNLLLTSLFDREVNCRRAASAALQEFVGRQGHEYFTESLSIISIADFFAVGNRTTAFLDLASAISALHPSYLTLFMNHLVSHKYNHWDVEVRILCSRAIARLLMADAASASDRLSALLPSCSSIRLSDRHGAFLVISTTLLGAIKSNNLAADAVKKLEEVLLSVDKQRLFRGKGGELVREAVCNTIESLARSRVKISSAKAQAGLVEILNDQLRQPHEGVQRAAQAALRSALFNFFADGVQLKPPTEALQKITVGKYLALQNEGNVAVTRGYTLALGALPERIAALPAGQLDTILATLEDFASSSKMILGDHDAETSRNSVEAVIELAERLCESVHFMPSHLQRCFSILFKAGEDYSVDKRGDTGSWCRILALQGLERLLCASLPRIISNGLPLQCLSIVEQARWMGPFGAGTVSSVLSSFGGVVLSVAFPPQSLGAAQSKLESWIAPSWQTPGSLVLAASSAWLTVPPGDAAVCEGGWSAIDHHALLSQAISLILKQMAEKLDAVRDVAGNVLCRLLKWCDQGPCREQLRSSVRSELLAVMCQAEDIQWGQAGQVFPLLAKALGMADCFHPVFAGLIISVGGVSKTIAKSAADNLLKVCAEHAAAGDNTFVNSMADSVVRLLAESKKVDRVVVPLLKTTELLLKNNILPPVARSAWVESIQNMLQEETKRCTNIPKLAIIIDIMSLLISFEPEHRDKSRDILQVLVKMLAHRYPKTRKHCGDVLYLLSVSASANHLGDLGLCSDKLLYTPWDQEDADAIFLTMNEVLEVLGFEQVQRDGAKAKAVVRKPVEETYEDLVREAGY